MNRKVQSTVMLIGILVLIVIAGSAYVYYYQNGTIEDNAKELKDLKFNAQNTEDLNQQLADLKVRIDELDSILALRKYIIPVRISQSNFFKFINKTTQNFSENSHVNVEYIGSGTQGDFLNFSYMLKGTAEFNDLFNMVYAIEQSKELKKVVNGNLKNFVEVDEEGFPHYLVNYSMEVQVLYSDNDMFATANYKENRLNTNSLYNIFFPLIREEIPPNTEELLDVQTAQLLALIPDGAYLADVTGKTHLLWEGDEVYLGYLTKIDYSLNEVKFILNKGGVVEKVTLKLESNKPEDDKKLTSK